MGSSDGQEFVYDVLRFHESKWRGRIPDEILTLDDLPSGTVYSDGSSSGSGKWLIERVFARHDIIGPIELVSAARVDKHPEYFQVVTRARKRTKAEC